ncbi:MAG TPA: MipA/OmpV family protein [Alphaproteobacteria bacterium]|nr:MipA/OmpV family protein [Alphaproteobacteria bacterium]
MKKLSLGFLCTVATFVISAAIAPANATDFTVGLGVGAAPDYEGSDDYQGVPTWLFSAKDLYHPDTYVTLAGPALRSNFVADPHLRAGVSGLYIPERNNVEDDAVDRMRSVDAGLFLGGIFGWDFFPQANADFAALLDLRYDVASDNGYLVTPRLSYFNRMPDSPFSIGAELFSNWASEDYMSEYFGVNASDAARSGLNTFDADAGFKDVGVSANVNYRFAEHWSATLLGGFTRLIDDAADSPVVDNRGDENQLFLGFTVNYRL